MCPIPNLTQFRNPRSKYRMISKVEVDFVFPRERRVEKEVSGRDVSIQGTGSYLFYRFFFFTSCSAHPLFIWVSDSWKFPAEITVHNPSHHPSTCAIPPWTQAVTRSLPQQEELHDGSFTLVFFILQASDRRRTKKPLTKVWEDCWQVPYSQTIKFIPVIT